MKRILSLFLFLFLLIPGLRAEDETASPAPQRQRPKVGVVLSGGGAKGMAHIGVLKVLEELNIPVDCIVGTSIGSIIGGLYALGYDATELDSLVRAQDWNQLMKDQVERRDVAYSLKKDDDKFIVTIPFMNHKMLTAETESARGVQGGLLKNVPSALVEGQNLNNLFTKLSVGYQDDVDFNTLPIPFACVAVDLNTKEEVVFHRGNIVTAIRSSMSIPGYFAPVQNGSQFLVDGGVLNNLPVDVAREMGADYIICVDLHHFKKNKADSEQTIPEMFSSLLSIMNGEKYKSGRAASDILIEPNTSAYGVLAFDDQSVDALVDSGLVAANRVRPQLLSLSSHLKTYQEPHHLRPPKAIDLSRDSVRITQMEIQGADAGDMAWLLSKTSIGPGELVSGNDMDQAMATFYNTRAFTKIAYAIAGHEGDYRLKIKFSPERIHQAGLGFRFDSEEMASILLGMSLNKHKLFGSKLDFETELGANAHALLRYGFTFHNLTQLSLSARLGHTAFDNYEAGRMLYTDRFNAFRGEAAYQITGWRNADIRFGVFYDNFREQIAFTQEAEDYVRPGEQRRGSVPGGFFNWQFDSLDDNYIPTRGLKLNLHGAASWSPGWTYEARMDLKAVLPLGPGVDFIPQTYNRWLLGESPARFYENTVGGSLYGRYSDWHLPFIGMNHVHSSLDRVDIARADLRINVFRQHFLTLTGNYLLEWNIDKEAKALDLVHNYGFGVSYVIGTIAGPVQVATHWSNISRTIGFYFSLGYDF